MSDLEIIYYIGLECTYDPSSSFTWTRIDDTENTDTPLEDALANWVADKDFSTKSSKLRVTLCFQKDNGNTTVASDKYPFTPVPGLKLYVHQSASYKSLNDPKKNTLLTLTDQILKMFVETQVQNAIRQAVKTGNRTLGGAKNTVYNFSNLPRNRDNKNDYYVYTPA
jgi:hypothetical protein